MDESGTSPPEVLLQSLNMLAQTHGRERKLSEYCHLLETAGFKRIKAKKTGTYLDAVIAFKDRPGGEVEFPEREIKQEHKQEIQREIAREVQHNRNVDVKSEPGQTDGVVKQEAQQS